MKRLAILLLLALALPSAARAEASGKKRRPLPYEYGTVVIKNHSEAAGLAPVVFEHWLHRAKYTCRLCHVDIGFAMKAGATDIKAADNMRGFYCGACHRKPPTGGRAVFEACAQPSPHEQRPACLRCHSSGKNVKPEIEFSSFTRALPRGRFGNGVDWEKAELEHLISPADYQRGCRSGASRSPRRRTSPSRRSWSGCRTSSSRTRSTPSGTGASSAIRRSSSA